MKFLIAIIMSISTTGLFAQYENELDKELRERNKISEILTYEYDLETGDSILTNHDFYDTLGNHLKDLRYNKNGEIRFKYIIEYNEDKLMTRQIGFNELNSISTILVYEYDRKGHRIDYKQLKPDGTILNHQKREYNKKGQNIKLYNKQTNSNDFYLSQKYYFRKDGQYERIERYSINAQLSATSEYEYNEDGNLIAVYQIVGSDRRLIFTNKFNDQNQRIEKYYPKKIDKIVNGELVTNETGKRIEYNYDSEGNLSEERTFENEKLVKKQKYFYKKFDT